MTVPNVVKTGDGYPIHTLVESDGGSGLQMTLWGAGATDGGLTGGERVRPAAVAGRRAEGEQATDGPVPVGGVYRGTPASVDSGDVVSLACDAQGRVHTVTEDGKNATLGSVNDARVDTDTIGTISGKLRGVVKLLNDLLSLLSSRLPSSLGQKTKDNSFPVVIASDQVVTTVPEQGASYYNNRISVSASPVRVVDANPNRLRVWITNDGGNKVWLHFIPYPPIRHGIRLDPGERIEIGPEWRGDIYAHTETNTTDVAVACIYSSS